MKMPNYTKPYVLALSGRQDASSCLDAEASWAAA